MKCTVVTPVGPGHQELAEDCRASVETARRHGLGPFAEVEHRCVDDAEGLWGRSTTRNNAVLAAARGGTDWVFFLDADDLLCADAFEQAGPLLDGHDAVWGAICEQRAQGGGVQLRDRQDEPIRDLIGFLEFDPFYALQMGHFVRTDVARAHPFDATMDAGEDFDYYLRVWTSHRCVKIGVPLFVNRRWQHSTGPRSASGRQWSRAIRRLRARYLQEHRASLRRMLAERRGDARGRRDKWRLRRWQLTWWGGALMRLRAWRPVAPRS